ncbi:gliding motility-associated C-terminal domain-containing protein [Bizionia echini]|uniref:Gliding motility-associated C-terminal domain-containing protein n=1 Tax=Bizionia echini TaxID=649333 RepID=A0A1I4ZC29_9FLAO|nr:choice-of-anchor J domain-containing protein [Bizionia echini]SFN47815.1 gliding motility-associated C-terminal domain-containing protein [Bizionia echini]
MRNKLQIAVAKSLFFSSKIHDNFYAKPFKKATQSKVLISGFLLTIFLLVSSKNFAQVNETFESGIPATWSLFGNSAATTSWGATTDGFLGSNAVSVNPSSDNIGDQNTAQYFLVTPQFAVPENGEIHFFTKQASDIDNGAEYQIRISTAAQPDINGFNIVLQSYTETNLNVGSQTTYEEKVIELPPSIPQGLDIYIAFVAVNTQNGATPTGDEWFIDNVSILEGCIEIEDDSVTIDNITVEGAEVTWSHPTASNFEIQVFPSGGTPAGAGIPVSATNYTLNGLDEDTEFDIYIRAVCDNATISQWSGPYTFQTLKFGLSCDAPIVVPDISATPYILADNLANYSNPDLTYTTQGTNCVTGNSNTNYLRGDKIFLSYTAPSDGLVTLTQTTFNGGNSTNNCFNSRSSLFVYDSCNDVGVNCIAGITTSNGFDPKTISNLLVQAGETYIIVVSSELSQGAGICFELEISSPTCAPPGDIIFNSLTENSVSFSWDNIGGFADSWEYMVVPAGAGEPTGSGTPTNTNVDNTINTGLSPATTYDFYVRAVCSGTPGTWSDPFTFTTQCTVFNTPYSTDFSNATNENPEPCWTTIDADGDGNSWGFIGGYATVRSDISRFQNNDFYVSPQINFDATPKRVRFKHRATQGIATYSLKLSTTGVGVDDFTTVLLSNRTINNNSFQETIVDIPEGITGNVNIAWIVEPNTTETALRVAIDDIFIEDKPTCPDPSDLFTLNITTNSAWLFWTPGDEETQWEVAIQDEGTGVPTGNGILVSSNFPYMATGLDSGNRYEFYVRAYCAADDQSEWIGPLAFTTLCESYDTPFFESFNDDDDDTQKYCWKITDANNDGTQWVIDENKALLETPPFSPASSYNDYLISPAINLDGNVKELKYKYRAQFSFFTGPPRYGLEVLMSTTNTNPGSFTVIEPLEVFTNTGYIEKSIILEGTGTIYIAFRVPPSLTGGVSILNIDDVSITDAPACPNPSDLIVNSVLADGADISWSAGYQEASWNVVVQPAGTGTPTGSGVQVSSPNYMATGLDSETDYEVYIQAACGTENSDWIGPVNFTTLCTAFTAPFVETFNSDSSSEICWQVVNDNGDLETWELDSAAFPYEGDQAAAMFTGTNGRNEDWLISPTITITENQRLRYYYRVFDSFFTEDLEVLLSTNGTGLDQFTTVLYDTDDDTEILNNVEYRVKTINLPAGITGDINIAFHVPFFPSTAPYRGQTLVIDNVNIEDIPACPEPTNITLSNISDTQVQVNWDANGSETEWEISVQPSGTPAPEGDTDPSYLYTADTNPFTVTGLSASTAYDVYVRAVCSGNDGAWTGPAEVTTLCSFENLCQYTFVLTSDSDISSSLDLTQNNQVVQSFPFSGQTGEEFQVFLCSGIQFSLYFQTLGSFAPQYANYQFEIRNDQGDTIYTSPLGLTPRRTVYEGTSTCGTTSCPQPTDLAVSETSVFSWSPGGTETQWEVAVQPFENGTLPQSGTIVSTNSYTPTAADFNDPNVATYEYFVRAVCGSGDESFWSGPFEFVRNDDVTNAITLPINSDEVCSTAGTNVSFINATASSEAMTCTGTNAGDVWFDFTAESLIHIIEINSFNGLLRENNGDTPYPDIIMTLYKDNGGVLEELTCSYDNVVLAMNASELVVGDNYKLRLTLNGTEPNAYRFNVCIKTPTDLCDFNLAVNGGFEAPVLSGLSGVNTIITMQVVPGWRQNLDSSNSVFLWESLNAPGLTPFEGGQFVQILTDQGTTIDPNDPDVKGYYRDFDTSEITLMEYSFAHYARFDGNAIELLAGPPGGPYTPVTLHFGDAAWQVVSGDYNVPDGQDTTRFIFRANGTDNIGNCLDAVSFEVNNDLITESSEVDCNNPTATVEANGVGTWIADENNPSVVTIADATSNNTSISGFVQPGTYTFTWKTSYCENTLELTYNGIGDLPTVETPVTYCLNATASPLTATATGTYTLLWFTQATGGTGSTTAPTPDTSIAATTSYFVANVDENGCEGPRAEIIVEVNDAITPELTFSYDNTCEVATDNPMPTLSTGFATGGIFSSATVTVDASSGEIDMASATAGSHDILYTFNGDPASCLIAGTYTATITFTAATVPVTTFDYGTTPFCLLNGTTVLPTLGTGFTTGGTFSSTTITVDAVTGELDLTSATVGMHDITYTIAAEPTSCLQEGMTTATIEVVETIIPETMFTYNQDTYCSDNANISPVLGTNFTTGGTFSAGAGLSINATTGEINISASTAGNYTVTYSILEDLTNCIEASSSTFSLTISATITPVTTFDYGTTPFCLLNGSSVTPTLTAGFTSGGTFSSATVTVDAVTGEVDLSSATTGMHTITYTLNADPTTCTLAGTSSSTIEVVEVNTSITDFTYSEDLYCSDSPNVLPNLAAGFTTGGTFSAETGLSINSSTGEINVSASSFGNYTIVYEVIENTTSCTEGSISMFDITIIDTVDVSVEGDCNGPDYVLTASPINNSFNPDDVTYTWMDANGNVVGQNSNEFNVTNYASQTNNFTVPAQFSVTVEFGSCSTVTTFTAERSSCKDIPRGISPDGNGKNDTFDLTGYGVTKMEIFSRNGRKVFDFTGNYTNQWYGQSNKGNDLPDGTYFYSIQKEDGTNATGWVFINRAQ